MHICMSRIECWENGEKWTGQNGRTLILENMMVMAFSRIFGFRDGILKRGSIVMVVSNFWTKLMARSKFTSSNSMKDQPNQWESTTTYSL